MDGQTEQSWCRVQFVFSLKQTMSLVKKLTHNEDWCSRFPIAARFFMAVCVRVCVMQVCLYVAWWTFLWVSWLATWAFPWWWTCWVPGRWWTPPSTLCASSTPTGPLAGTFRWCHRLNEVSADLFFLKVRLYTILTCPYVHQSHKKIFLNIFKHTLSLSQSVIELFQKH